MITNVIVSSPSAEMHPDMSSPVCDTLPSLDSILRVRVPILRHVPKGTRDAWAGIVGEVLLTITSAPSNLTAWCKLFMLARCILANPVRGGRSHWRDTLNSDRCRIRRWKAGAFNDLWSEVLQEDYIIVGRDKTMTILNALTTGASETEIVAATDTSLEALEEQERADDGAVITEADDVLQLELEHVLSMQWKGELCVCEGKSSMHELPSNSKGPVDGITNVRERVIGLYKVRTAS